MSYDREDPVGKEPDSGQVAPQRQGRDDHLVDDGLDAEVLAAFKAAGAFCDGCES
jgi:hypothetical protein